MEKLSNSFWEVTYRQNIARMIGVCCRYTQDRETAEDLAHDAFLIAIDKVSSFENRGPFEAWLRRIVVNVALQYLRKQKNKEKIHGNLSDLATFNELIEEVSSHEDSSFSEAELLEAIALLPEHHRLVFNLYVIDNFTHAQIAEQLGISEGTSKSHLARARKKIRELLHLQLRKNKKRREAFSFLLTPYQIWDIDTLISSRLNDLSVAPLKNRPIDNITSVNGPIPKLRPQIISRFYLKSGVLAITGVALLVAVSNLHIFSFKESQNSTIPVAPKATKVSTLDEKIYEAENGNLFSDSISATISGTPIIVEKTKNDMAMKNFKTLGGLLIAGLAFDSTAMPKELPVSTKNQQTSAIHIPESTAVTENLKHSKKGDGKLLTGTFYASKLFWSETNSKLFLLGDDVKVDLNTQKFKGSGKFSFIDHLTYVIVDGTQMKLNETIDLEKKKYHLNELTESEGFKKYGEKGKSGVIEITIAE